MAPIATAAVTSVGSTSRVPAATINKIGNTANSVAVSTAVVVPRPQMSTIHGSTSILGTP